MTTPSSPVLSPDLAQRNRRVIWLLLASAFTVILNETIMSVAVSDLMEDLRIDARAAQWLTTAFMLTMAIIIPISGYLIQRLSTRTIFIAAMTLFSLGTLIGAIAPGFEVLLAARVVQACGTAIMMPLLMTTILQLVPPANRGAMMGNVSTVIAVAPALGPTLSGLILNTLGWRWMFWFVLPIAVGMLIVGYRKVENVTEPSHTPLDLLSIPLAALGFGGLVYGLSLVGAEGEEQIMTISFAIGAVFLALFVGRQLMLQRRDRALLDLRTFASGNFALAVTLMVVSVSAMFGCIILLPLYLQQVLGLEPLYIGLLVLPGGLLMGLLAPFVGRLYDRFGPRVLIVPGTAIVSCVLWFFTTLTEHTSPFLVLGAHLTLSLGLAMLFTPLMTAGLGSLPFRLYSHGSALVGTVQQVAGAAGTALFMTILASVSAQLGASGVTDAVAIAGGARAAFLTGAIISLGAIVLAFFVRKPLEHPESEPSASGASEGPAPDELPVATPQP